MRSARLTAVLVTVVLAGCAAKAPPYNPFRIEEATFRQKIRTIALYPLSLPNDVENREAVKKKFEDLIAGRLQQYGYTALPPSKAGELYESLRKEAGGVFDPITGERNEAKVQELEKKFLAGLGERYKADAVLYSSIYIVDANFGNGVAAWGGTKERIESGGHATFRILGGVSVSGHVGALSLGVVMKDMSDAELYSKAGGIEALQRYGMNGLTPKPIPELFKNEVRNIQAVDIALEELNPNPTPDKGEKPAPPSASLGRPR